MRPLLRWLHLSDLHHGLRDDGSDKHDRLATFFEDVEALVGRRGPVDLVLFTGDLTQYGTVAQFEELDALVIEPLRKATRGATILAVPGNHDLERPAGRPDKLMASALCDKASLRQELWDADEEVLKFIRERFAAYAAWWERTQPAGVRPGFLPGDFLYTIEREGLRLGVAGLNSTAFHLGDVKEGDLHVHPRQLRDACGGGAEVRAWLDGQGFNLLMTHHPPSWLDATCRSEHFDGGLQAGRFDLHLFGHVHTAITTEKRLGGGATERSAQAASMFGLEKRADGEGERRFGYALVELCDDGGTLTTRTFPRRASKGQDKRWRYGSDQTHVLLEDYLAAEPTRFDGRAAPAEAPRAVPAARVCHADATGWEAAVADHPAWGHNAGEWKARALAVIRVCAAAWADAAGVVGKDPWRDADLPVRTLDRLGELVKPGGLRVKQAALLLAAPFVYEAVRAATLAWVAGADIEDLGQRSDAPPPRPALEEVHRAHARELRLVERAGKLGDGRARAIALWMAYRTVDRVPEVWDPTVRTAVQPLHARIVDALGGDSLAPLLRDLARCLEPGLERLDGAQGLWRRQKDGDRDEPGRLGTLLVAAGALGLDLRRLDPLVVDHIGTDEEFEVVPLREGFAAARWSASGAGKGEVRVLAVECPNAVTHYLVVDLVQQARTVLAALRRDARDSLPGGVSEAEVKPVRDGKGEKFRPVHVRFRLDHVRVRELLMGQQLYGDPSLAIRELYQNALDACRYRRVRTAFLRHDDIYYNEQYEGRIVLRQGRRPDGRLVIECDDDGVGMDELMLERVFAVAGQRFHDQPGYLEEKAKWEGRRQRIKDPKEAAELQLWPNSHHGIGVLSYFMLADELEILTRAFRPDGKPGEPIRVEISSASGLFRVTRGPEDLGIGTRVRLVLEREEYKNADGKRHPVSLAGILGRLLVVAEVPVVVEEEGLAEGWERTWRFGAGVEKVRWETGIPRVPDGARWSFLPAQPPFLWWTDRARTPLLVDGVATKETRGTVLLNLTGPHPAKRVSADRAKVLDADFSWVEAALTSTLAELANWSELTHDWLKQVFAHYPELHRTGWASLLRLDPDLSLYREAESDAPGRERTLLARAPIAHVGFLRLDPALVVDSPRNALQAWRTSRWRRPSRAEEAVSPFSALDPAGPAISALLTPGYGGGADGKPLGPRLDAVWERFAEHEVRQSLASIELTLGLPKAATDTVHLSPLALGELVAVLTRAEKSIFDVVGEASAQGRRIPSELAAVTEFAWRDADRFLLSRDGDGVRPWIGGRVSLEQGIMAAAKRGGGLAPTMRRLAEIAQAGLLKLGFDPECASRFESSAHLARGAGLIAAGRGAPILTALANGAPDEHIRTMLDAYVDAGADPGCDVEVLLAHQWEPHERECLQLIVRGRTGRSRRLPASLLIAQVGEIATLAHIAPLIDKDLGPKGSRGARTTVDALRSNLARHPETPAHINPHEQADRWLLQACDHTCRFGIDPTRAVACAGRWWCWWLTEDERTELGAPLIPIVTEEAAWWERVRDEDDDV